MRAQPPHWEHSFQRLVLLAIAITGIIHHIAHANPTQWKSPQRHLICVDELGKCTVSSVDLRHLEDMIEIVDVDNVKCGVSDPSTIATDEIIGVLTVDANWKDDIFCKTIDFVPLEKLLKMKLPRIKRQSGYPRGRFRGQTQSQYLNIGNDGNEGKAEAQSVADSSRAVVSGTSGMGQAQSQTVYDPGCDECGQSNEPGVDSLKRYPGTNRDTFGQPIDSGTNQPPHRPFGTPEQQSDSRKNSQGPRNTGTGQMGSGTYGTNQGEGPGRNEHRGQGQVISPSGIVGGGSNIPNTVISGPYTQSPGGAVNNGQGPGGNRNYGPNQGSGPSGPLDRGTNVPNVGISGTDGQSPGIINTYGKSPGGAVSYGRGSGGSANYGPYQSSGPGGHESFVPSAGSGPNGPVGSGSNVPNTGINGPYGQTPGGSSTYGQNAGRNDNYGQGPGGSGNYDQTHGSSGPVVSNVRGGNVPNTGISRPYDQSPGGGNTYGQSPDGAVNYGQRPDGSVNYGTMPGSGPVGPGGHGSNIPITGYGQTPVGSGNYGQSPDRTVSYVQRPSENGNYGQRPGIGPIGAGSGGNNLPKIGITGPYGEIPGVTNTYDKIPTDVNYGQSPGGNGNYGPTNGPSGPIVSRGNEPNTDINGPYGQSPGGSNTYGQNPAGTVSYGQGPGGSVNYGSRSGSGPLGPVGIGSNIPTAAVTGPYGQTPGSTGNYGQSPGSNGILRPYIPAGVGGNNEQSVNTPINPNEPQNIVSPIKPGSVWPQIGPNGEKYVCCLVNSNYPSGTVHGESNQPQVLTPNQINGNAPETSYGLVTPQQTGMLHPAIQSNQQPPQVRQDNIPNSIISRPGANQQNPAGQSGFIPGNVYPQPNQPQVTLGSPNQQTYNQGTSQFGGPSYTGITSSLPYDANKAQNGYQNPYSTDNSLSQRPGQFNPTNNKPGQTQYNTPQGIPGSSYDTRYPTSNANINQQGYTTFGANILPGASVPTGSRATNLYTPGGTIPNAQSPNVAQTVQIPGTPNAQNSLQPFSQHGQTPGTTYPASTGSGYNNLSPNTYQGGGPGVFSPPNNLPTGTYNTNQGYTPDGSPNIGITQGGANTYGTNPQERLPVGNPALQPSPIPGTSNFAGGNINYNTPGQTGDPWNSNVQTGGPRNGYVQGSIAAGPTGSPYANQGQSPSTSYGTQGTSNIPNQQTNYGGVSNEPSPDANSGGVPQNVVDPNSIAASYDDDSEALVSVSQDVNGTVASASSKGGSDKGRAQTQVEGTYTGTGSFSAQAQINDDTKGAESHVSGGKQGATSSALGKGRNNKSQAQVQLGSETGSLQTQAGTDGVMHSSNSQVQGSVKGGMADAQARGPGSTSSQAQIGFTPYKESEKAVHDALKSPFVGGGTASAHSTGRTGQSQTQLQGTFKYGISYNGAAQSGASLDKDAVFSTRLPFNKLDVFDESNKNINVNGDQPPVPSISEIPIDDHPHSDHHSSTTDQQAADPANPATGRRSFKSSQDSNPEYEYPTDKDDNQPFEYETDGNYDPEVPEGDYPNYEDLNKEPDPLQQTRQNAGRKSLEIKQTLGGNTQHIILGPLNNRDAQIVQKSSDQRPDENRIYQPGELVPGTGGYTIPIGFTGSVKAVSSKSKTYAIGSKDSPSQAQTVSLSPGTGKVKYDRPRPTYYYGRNVPQQDLKSLYDKQEDNNRYMSVSKSVTGALDGNNNIKKQYSHTYYTKSSSCGYFTFTCTIVSGSDGRKKVCRPKIPVNPDGTPMKC